MRATAGVFISAIVALVLTGCVSARSEAAAAIRDADDAMVAGCTFLGTVSGSSMMSAGAAEKGRKNAKTAALEDAAGMGATHIVWTDVSTVFQGGSSATGKAYRCSN